MISLPLPNHMAQVSIRTKLLVSVITDHDYPGHPSFIPDLLCSILLAEMLFFFQFQNFTQSSKATKLSFPMKSFQLYTLSFFSYFSMY